MNPLLIVLLLQALIMPPRVSLENPASLAAVPQKLKKDYDKAWTRFLDGKQDAKLSEDLTKLLKKQKGFEPAIMIQAYLDLYGDKTQEAELKLEQVLNQNPNNRVALYYLAELAFGRNDYTRANDLYTKLSEIDKSRPELETKRQKALLLATENILRRAAQAESENRLAEAEALYRHALRIAPREPGFHANLGVLLARQAKWDEALTHYREQIELEGRRDESEKNMAEALMHLGRTEEAREILDRMRDSGSGDAVLDGKVRELENLGRWGNEIERFREIQSSAVLTREQLSAMLVRYFPQITEFRQTPQIVTDTQESWARAEIQTIVGVGLIDKFPNHTFQPGSAITRGELALSLSRLMRVLTVAPSSAPLISTPDVVPSNALHAHVQYVLGHGLMELDDSGNFNLHVELSGEEAIRALTRLLHLARGKDQFNP